MKLLLCKIADLELLDAPIFLGYLKGMTTAEIARELKFSRARMCARVKAAMRRAPWLLKIHTNRVFGLCIPKSVICNTEIAGGVVDDISSGERLPASFRPVALVSVYTGAIMRTFPTLADFARDRNCSHAKARSLLQNRTKIMKGFCRLVYADVPLPADLARLRETGTDGQEPRTDAPGHATETDTPTEENE